MCSVSLNMHDMQGRPGQVPSENGCSRHQQRCSINAYRVACSQGNARDRNIFAWNRNSGHWRTPEDNSRWPSIHPLNVINTFNMYVRKNLIFNFDFQRHRRCTFFVSLFYYLDFLTTTRQGPSFLTKTRTQRADSCISVIWHTRV